MNKKGFRAVAASVLMAAVLTFPGCGGGGGGTGGEEKKPNLKMQVVKLEQFDHIGDKVSDGQYAFLTVSLTNDTIKDLDVSPTDFILQNVTDKPEEQFQQGIEKNMGGQVYKQLGKEIQDKLIEATAVTLHPRLEQRRFLIFNMPKDAVFEKYQLKYKPDKVVVPLMTPDTEVLDHRGEAINAGNPEEKATAP